MNWPHDPMRDRFAAEGAAQHWRLMQRKESLPRRMWLAFLAWWMG
jgi:hypothetical protein